MCRISVFFKKDLDLMKQWQLVVPYGCRWAEQNDPPIHLGDQEPQKTSLSLHQQ